MRILVVEDEKKLANSIKRCLKEKGYAVDMASNGDDGLFQDSVKKEMKEK